VKVKEQNVLNFRPVYISANHTWEGRFLGRILTPGGMVCYPVICLVGMIDERTQSNCLLTEMKTGTLQEIKDKGKVIPVL
jgi:hypothetical protein